MSVPDWRRKCYRCDWRYAQSGLDGMCYRCARKHGDAKVLALITRRSQDKIAERAGEPTRVIYSPRPHPVVTIEGQTFEVVFP